MVQDEMLTDEGQGGIPTGPIIAAAIAAGVAAFLIRRARHEEPKVAIETPTSIAATAWAKAQDTDFRRKTAEATRDWVWERVVPELRPILLDLLKGVKDLVDDGFKKAEKTIKDL
jgi:hypothetical protein